MTITDLVQRSAAEFDQRVAAVENDQWHLPTPCDEWDVRALVHHVVYETLWIAPLLEGQTLEQVGDRYEGDVLGDDPKGAWRRAVDEALAGIGAPGAADGTVHTSSGETPSEEYLSQIFSEFLIHGWDLAKGIGRLVQLPEDLCETLYEMMAPKEDEMKSWGFYGGKVDPGSDAAIQAKVLAVFGRTA